MKRLLSMIMAWLPFAIVITGMCALVSATVQQNYRQSLNDPQIQMAEDGAEALSHGIAPVSVVPRGAPVDISTSLSTWMAVYSGQGSLLETSGVLDGGAMPQPPKGIFDDARASMGKDTSIMHEDRITWQPRIDTRQAIVIVWSPAADQFVVAGRNMREVEDREGRLQTMVGIAWIVLMLSTLAVIALKHYYKHRRPNEVSVW